VAGLEPFWGPGAEPLRWLDVTAPPRRLTLAAPLVAFGRPARWMTRAGYRSGRSARLELTLEGALVVDGEILHVDAATPFALAADEHVGLVAWRHGPPRQRRGRGVAAPS